MAVIVLGEPSEVIAVAAVKGRSGHRKSWYHRSLREEKSMPDHESKLDKECPLCTSNMRVVTRQVTTRLPGTSQMKTTTFDEWVCPDCDYFEETEELEG